MCTRDENFTILGTEDCLARGYERTGFVEVDTQNKTDWTLQLTLHPSDTAAARTENQDANAPPEGDTGASGRR